MHARTNVVVVARAEVLYEPPVASLPVQPPEAVQDVACVEDQVSVELPPLLTALGPTLRLTVGVAAFTETVADCTALPPAPVQVRV